MQEEEEALKKELLSKRNHNLGDLENSQRLRLAKSRESLFSILSLFSFVLIFSLSAEENTECLAAQPLDTELLSANHGLRQSEQRAGREITRGDPASSELRGTEEVGRKAGRLWDFGDSLGPDHRAVCLQNVLFFQTK